MEGITINIPVYNEEELLVPNTEKLLGYLKERDIEHEVIIVSNGSTDRTVEIGKKLQSTYDTVRFFFIEQKGVGIAFRIAASNAKFEKMISMDMDLAVNLSFITQAKDLLDRYTIVLGSKVLGNQKRSLIRKAGSFSYIYFSKLILGLKFHDYSIGGKGFKTKFVLDHINYIDDETNYVIALTLCARKKGYKVIEIPVECIDNRASRFNLIKEAIYRYSMLLKLLRISYKLKG